MSALSPPEVVAERVLKDFWDQSLPVDSAALAKKMGVRAYLAPELPASGQSAALESGEYKIQIKPGEPVYRQRFTVARELGLYA